MLKKHSSHILLLIFLVVAFIAATFGGGGKHITTSQPVEVAEEKPALVQAYKITEKRRTHILYGSSTGGGHIFGANKKGKSEFPQSWDADKIIRVALEIANDESIPMRPSGRYWLKLKDVDGVMVRVVLDKEKGEVVTAYPYVPRKRRD